MPAAQGRVPGGATVLGAGSRASTAASPGPAATATQIWYPSAGIHQKKGVLVGAYIWSEDAGDAFAAKPPAQRLADTLADGEAAASRCRGICAKGVSVAWKKIPFSVGAWAEWSREARAGHYRRLLDRRRAVPVLRRAYVLHQRLAGRRGPLRPLHAAERSPPGSRRGGRPVPRPLPVSLERRRRVQRSFSVGRISFMRRRTRIPAQASGVWAASGPRWRGLGQQLLDEHGEYVFDTNRVRHEGVVLDHVEADVACSGCHDWVRGLQDTVHRLDPFISGRARR